MTSKRIALAVAALALSAGVAASLAQSPPDPLDLGAVDDPTFYADAGPGGPGGPDEGYGPGGRRFGPGRRGPGFGEPRRLAAYLELTDAQRASARQLFEQQRDKVRPILEHQRDLREQLETTLDDPAASDAALGQLVKQLHANRQAMKGARQDLRARLTALLDPAQKAKLDRLESMMLAMRAAGPRHRGLRR